MKKYFFTSLFIFFYTIIILAQNDLKNSNYKKILNKEDNYILKDIKITGTKKFNKNKILNFSNLNIGDRIRIYGNKINYAIKKLWETNLFNDIKISVLKIENEKIYLEFYLKEIPELSEIKIIGIKKKVLKNIFKEKYLDLGKKISGDILKNIKNEIEKYFIKKGFNEVKVYIISSIDIENKIKLIIKVKKGFNIKISKVFFEGNKKLTNRQLINVMKNVKKKFFFTTFYSSKCIREKFEEDLKNIIKKYKSLGFNDAHILSYYILKVNKKKYIIKIKIKEGIRYYLGDISFIGNKLLNTKKMKNAFFYKKGDIYNPIDIEKKIFDSQNKKSIYSLYIKKGYLFTKIIPIEANFKNNIVNLKIYIKEYKLTYLNKVNFSGNLVTKDHVIARELTTCPGQIFSKNSIKSTLFNLSQLGFFDLEKTYPDIKPNFSNSTLDVNWNLIERSFSQFQLQGGYGGKKFVGIFNLNFNNFSMKNIFHRKKWNPIPQGDSQQLSLSLQRSTNYYSYNISFIEPWIRHKTPTSLNFSINYSKQTKIRKKKVESVLNVFKISLGGGKRLNYPDNYFSIISLINYDYYNRNNTNMDIEGLPKYGLSNDLNYLVSFRRISLIPDQIFPKSGSEFAITGIFTFPYSFFERKIRIENKWIEYYKLKIKSYWYKEIKKKIISKIGGEFGILEAYNFRKKGISPFQRFIVGDPSMAGFQLSGQEYISLRGYINSKKDNDIFPQEGGVIYNKFLLEFRYPIMSNRVGKFWILSFLESGNTSEEYKKYKFFDFKKSTGVGFRFFINSFGFLGFDFAYGFENKTKSKWRSHIVIGRDF